MRKVPSRGRNRKKGEWQTSTKSWGNYDGTKSTPFGNVSLANPIDFNIFGIIPTAGASALVTGAVPTGAVIVSDLDLTIGIDPVGALASYLEAHVLSGLYLGEFDSITSTFSTQDPMVPGDMERDNWLDLQVHPNYWSNPQGGLIGAVGTGTFPITGAGSAICRYKVPLRRPVRIDEGWALRLRVSTPSSATLRVWIWCRWKERYVF